MEEEGYLALRWNNHNTIFTKILSLLREQEAYADVSLACGGKLYAAHKFVLSTCSDYFKDMFSKTPCKHPVVFMKDVTGKDMESLLDFMYKGEVHVPQSELGSLLRTAEGLQVKGLAVPDDTSRSSSVLGMPDPTAFAPSVPSVEHFVNMTTNKAPQMPLLSTSLPVKRKRVSDSMKKDEPPKLTHRNEVSGHNSSLRNSSVVRNSRGKSRVTGLPELKRIKLGLEENLKIIRNNTHVADANDTTPDTNNEVSESVSDSSLLQKEEESNELIPVKKIKIEVDIKPEEDMEGSGSMEQENGETETNENERNSIEDEGDGDEEEDGGEENSSPVIPSEADENSSLPNSEISTAELLHVDLSEDGTQFIIGPGGIGGEASRTSSAAEEEVAEGPKKPFICLLCGHTFTRRDNLANHLKTHTGDRPFMCQYCHKCFSRKDYLKQHERIHTGEKPYACEICGRAFTRKEGLTDHMRCHSDFKAFACENCGKSFKQKCGLRFHKRNYRH